INATLYEQSLTYKAYEGMGTTAVIVISTADYITVAHIGDSRCYMYNENGLRQITEDHSIVNELIRSDQITKEDALNHQLKNVVLKNFSIEKEVKSDINNIY